VAFELATLAALTSIFLVAVPTRPVWVEAGLALFAAALVAATARRTRAAIWGPPPTAGREGVRHSVGHLLIGTLGAAALFAVIGTWTGRAGPLFPATMLPTLVAYLPWAVLQQVLFQVYLLGRLRVLLPASSLAAPAVNGALFGAVHLPDLEITALTTVGGAVWSWYYLRDRRLLPIAISHAVLGTTYYFWIRGEDLLLRWFSAAG
jgi:membrane protease YdiL (CAAX protease family)